MTQKLLRVEAVAERLDIGVSTAYRLVANGTIPSVKIGGARRVPEEQLLAWIDEQCRAGAKADAK